MKTSSERLAGGSWLIRAEGEADFGTSPALEAGLKGPLADPRPRLLLDLSGLTYISSAGLRVLLRAGQRTSGEGGWLRLFGLQPGVRKVLVEASLTEILPIFSSREAAEAASGEAE
jgi:anti-anti-sigma factor